MHQVRGGFETVLQDFACIEACGFAGLLLGSILKALLTHSPLGSDFLEEVALVAAVVAEDEAAETTVVFAREESEGCFAGEAHPRAAVWNPIVPRNLDHY